MLNDRKKRILGAIVEEYISTAEPVSSASIVQKYGFNFSSATIRNEMAELEEEGYLEKPHTSAGRIPSAKGYRFYVDQLIREDNIDLEEIGYIKSKLESRVVEIEDLLKIATNTLSEITHYTSIAIRPKPEYHIIEDVKFILLGSRMLMSIILTDAGVIKESIIKFEEDVNEDLIQQLNIMFNAKLKGKPLTYIDKPMEEYIGQEVKNSLKIITPIVQEFNNAIEQYRTDMYLEGTTRVFDFPEFKKLETARNFLSVLETKDLVRDIFDSGFASNINVYIGDESGVDEFRDFSIVTFKHMIEGKELGTIGIIGPKRMDYSKVISVMKYISKKLNQNLDERKDE